jgi:hypothetical protein
LRVADFCVRQVDVPDADAVNSIASCHRPNTSVIQNVLIPQARGFTSAEV